MCLELSVGGVQVQFDRNVCGLVGSVMSTKLITIENVIEMMKCMIETKMDDAKNVYHLYILMF